MDAANSYSCAINISKGEGKLINPLYDFSKINIDQHFVIKIYKFINTTTRRNNFHCELISPNCVLTDIRNLGQNLSNYPIYQSLGFVNVPIDIRYLII